LNQSQHAGTPSVPTSRASDMVQRRARLFQVRERLPKPELALASLSYLSLRYLNDVAVGEVGGRLPYAADSGSNCLFYSVHEDPAALFHCPFLYQAQYESVQKFLAVPFDQLGEMDRDAPSGPTFVFSIGRCGSTLLVRMLVAAGLTAISEPDIFSQMARPEAQKFAPRDRRQCLAAAARCFAAHSHREVVIKLRSACNTIAPLIMGSTPASRCEFILRNRRDWARSMFAVGPFEATMLAKQLAVALMALDRLIALGHCSGPVWYEDIVREPKEILRRFPTSVAAQEDAELARAISQDSQSGTILSREHVARRAVSDDVLNRFEEEWRKIRPQAIMTKLGLTARL